ncbi:MAG: membrane protein insertase YidC [Puniceicoccaceae bacterium]|nr:MAG: membrane protein insertase YidC [Puniceicoccaceae bacterium]
MDTRNIFIGLLLLFAAFAVLFYSQRQAPPPPRPAPVTAPSEPLPEPPGIDPADPETPAPRAPAPRPAPRPRTEPIMADVDDLSFEDEQVITLENDFVAVRLTNFGGAILEVVQKQHALEKGEPERFVFNAPRYAPALTLMDFPGAGREAAYTVVRRSETEVVFRVEARGGFEITRIYRLDGDNNRDPYLVRHELIIHNLGEDVRQTPTLSLNVGTAAPADRTDSGYFLNFGYFDGRKAKFIRPNQFEGGFMSMIGLRPSAPRAVIEEYLTTQWVSVKNQFFTSILTPDEPGIGYATRRVEFPLVEGERSRRVGITGQLLVGGLALDAGQTHGLGFDFYAGPKEYPRLASFDREQDRVMQFGIFGFFSKLLLSMMNAIYSVVPNYGIAIIGTTMVIKTLFWPITAVAARSSKRMAKISEPMKLIREKFKDDPRKQQEATLELFRQNKVNPLGGCLPILVQIPIFIGLFRMLQSAAELRHEGFLWIEDLSRPDTLGHLFGLSFLPLNPLPLLMGLTMWYQMKLMPTPTVDNMQAKIFKVMPFIFTVFCYFFSSGLVLYWTVQNLFTILQQYLMNRRDDPTPVIIPPSLQAETAKAGAAPRKRRKGKAGSK